jgi:hypothetical protein
MSGANMAKAKIVTKSGTTIDLEGTAEEIAALIEKFEGRTAPVDRPSKRSDGQKRKAVGLAKKQKQGPKGLVAELVDEGFFAKPRTFKELGDRLKEGGHYYPRTSLSPVMLALTKDRIIRRIKSGKHWTYVA